MITPTIITSTKIDDDQISVTKTETIVTTTTYSYKFLVAQRVSILNQKAQQDAQRDKEVADVDVLLAECTKLGVVT